MIDSEGVDIFTGAKVHVLPHGLSGWWRVTAMNPENGNLNITQNKNTITVGCTDVVLDVTPVTPVTPEIMFPFPLAGQRVMFLSDEVTVVGPHPHRSDRWIVITSERNQGRLIIAHVQNLSEIKDK